MSECQDAPRLRRALESAIPLDILIQGDQADIERSALKELPRNQKEIAKVIKHYPIKAKCPEGHPTIKNYGNMWFTSNYSKNNTKQDDKNKNTSNQPNQSGAATTTKKT